MDTYSYEVNITNEHKKEYLDFFTSNVNKSKSMKNVFNKDLVKTISLNLLDRVFIINYHNEIISA